MGRKCLLFIILLLSVPTFALAEDPAIKVTLLGTGTPSLSADRFGNSTLVQAAGLDLVFDAGRGSTIRLAQLGVPLGDIDATFLTHYHSDHYNGLADLWVTSFLRTPQNGRDKPFELYGPRGVAEIAAAMKDMFQPDINIRLADGEVIEPVTQLYVHEFDEPAVVYESNGVRVSAFAVDHGDAIKPAVGYRVDHAGHSVVISGDTRYSETIIEQATNVDLLIHEVSAISTHHIDEAWAVPIAAHHTSPEEAGRVFAYAKPKMAVFTHISRPGPKDETNTDQAIHDRAATEWDGPIVVGSDLMQINIGDSVEVSRFEERQ